MITTLGEANYPSPVNYAVDDRVKIPASIKVMPGEQHEDDLMFELAGPRSKMFFDPAATKAGIVTCGGIMSGNE